MVKSKDYFKVGENNISYIWGKFTELFGDMDVKLPKRAGFQTKTLGKRMNDKEILSTLKPARISLGDLALALKSLDKSGWYICYIEDASNTVWAVGVCFSDGGWSVDAFSVECQREWRAGPQVLSRGFSDTLSSDPLTLSPSDALKSAIELVKESGYKVIKEF